MAKTDQYVTFYEAAQMAGESVEALRRRWLRHKLPTEKINPRRVLIRLDVLRRHLRERSVR
jgi:hypothetical protein